MRLLNYTRKIIIQTGEVLKEWRRGGARVVLPFLAFIQGWGQYISCLGSCDTDGWVLPLNQAEGIWGAGDEAGFEGDEGRIKCIAFLEPERGVGLSFFLRERPNRHRIRVVGYTTLFELYGIAMIYAGVAPSCYNERRGGQSSRRRRRGADNEDRDDDAWPPKIDGCIVCPVVIGEEAYPAHLTVENASDGRISVAKLLDLKTGDVRSNVESAMALVGVAGVPVEIDITVSSDAPPIDRIEGASWTLALGVVLAGFYLCDEIDKIWITGELDAKNPRGHEHYYFSEVINAVGDIEDKVRSALERGRKIIIPSVVPSWAMDRFQNFQQTYYKEIFYVRNIPFAEDHVIAESSIYVAQTLDEVLFLLNYMGFKCQS